MRVQALLFLLFLNLLPLRAQTVKELNKAAKSSTHPGPGSSSSYKSSNDAFAAWMLLRSLIWFGQAAGQLGREEARLARRNREENHLFCLDVKPQAGYGLSGFIRLQPQVRANIGWFSLDLKQSILQDASAEFKTRSLMCWLNFLNKGKFRIRGGIGALGMNASGETFLQFGLGAEFIPSPAIRFEAEAGQSESLIGTGQRPLREILLRIYHPFWTKGILQASVFAGACNQQYFQNMDFTTLDAGLNFRISASRYK